MTANTRREVLAAGLLLCGQGLVLSCRSWPESASDALSGWRRDGLRTLRAAADWCWAQQSEDGRFRSATYGLLRGGASLTPFVLLALHRAAALPEEPTARAAQALLALQNEEGALGFEGPAPDYPCYATGMLLSALARTQAPGVRDASRAAVAWLRTQQFSSARGWADHPAQGGWGMGARTPLTPPHAGHVDLSMTRRVIEGLRDAGLSPEDPCLIEARDFVMRCQSADGGFFYSPVEQALNKGRRHRDGAPAGYGSATSDGLLCLLALGQSETANAERAHHWLLAHHRNDANPGLENAPMETFATAMRGYYRAGSSECFARLRGPADWRRPMVESVVSEQHEDGSFRNANALQKENDPLIATAFAIQALANALETGPA